MLSDKAEATRATFHEQKARSDIAHDRAQGLGWLSGIVMDSIGASAKSLFPGVKVR
jgi:hypothetical protein